MRTLADMTPTERAQCRGMWCEDVDGFLLVYRGDHECRDWLAVCVYPDRGDNIASVHSRLTLRPDFPRAWTPDGTPPAGQWEEAEYLGDYKSMTDVYYYDGDPTHRRFVSEWEEA